MAIVKMQKLDLLVARSQKDELLLSLMKLGCVELREQDDVLSEPIVAQLVSKETSDSARWRGWMNLLANAIKIIDRYAPAKTPLLAPKPEISQEQFLKESGIEKAVNAAHEIISLDEKEKNLTAEKTKTELLIEALTPWKGCDLPLDTKGTKNVAVIFGTVPTAIDLGEVNSAVAELTEEFQIFEIGADEHLHYINVFFTRDLSETVLSALRGCGFSFPAYGNVQGTAAENISASEETIAAFEAEREECRRGIIAAAGNRELLKLSYDRISAAADREDAAECLLKTETAVSLKGWVAEPEIGKLKELLDGYDCAYEFTEPIEEEYPEVPVELKNNKLTDGLNMVTDMYSLPQYGSVDPNPLMAPFFILFYGIMMADMGYGIVMMIIGLLITLKKHPKTGFLRYFGELMIEGGIATFIMGAFTGGFFGDAPKWIVQLINPESTWEGIPALIDPLNDTVLILAGALILGFIHLNAGMVVSFVMKTRSGNIKDAIWEEGAMWLLFIGIACAFLKLGTVAGVPLVLLLGLLAFAYGKTRPAKGIGKLMAIFSGIYNEVTGWFGDILSYARLMALMLAGSVIAQVFNTLGAMPGNIVVFIIICIFGNALNFGLNLLGCYVHDLRLQCLEFFNKFYVAGGRAFAPLKIRAKFYDVTE